MTLIKLIQIVIEYVFDDLRIGSIDYQLNTVAEKLLFDRLYVRRRAGEVSRLLGDLALDAFLIVLVATQLFPLFESPRLLFRDPVGFLYRPVGPAGIAFALLLFFLWAALKLHRRRPLPRRFFSFAGMEVGVFAAAGLIAFFTVPLILPTPDQKVIQEPATDTRSDERRRIEDLDLRTLESEGPETGGEQQEINWDADYLIVNLWATWCPPCRGEIPELNSFYAQHVGSPVSGTDAEVEMVGVNLTHSEPSVEKVEEFIGEHRIVFPVLLDPEGRIGELIHTESIPTTVVFGPHGKVRAFRQGVVSASWLKAKTIGSGR